MIATVQDTTTIILEIVFTRAAPAFDNLFMGCVFNINTLHKTVEKLTFQAWGNYLEGFSIFFFLGGGGGGQSFNIIIAVIILNTKQCWIMC